MSDDIRVPRDLINCPNCRCKDVRLTQWNDEPIEAYCTGCGLIRCVALLAAPPAAQPTILNSIDNPADGNVRRKEMNQDTRSTSIIVAECGTLAQSIHDLTKKRAAGDGNVEPQLTNEMYQLAHDEGILSVRHAKGDTAAVFKNPFARV